MSIRLDELGHGLKPVPIETLVAESTVEGILIQVARVDEMQPDVVRVGAVVYPR